jgi:ubiquinone/menaquinone biosynthesis C-methylase UbiE
MSIIESLVLDACCGAEKIYQGWNKRLGDNFIGIDIRKGDFSYSGENNWTKNEVLIKPTVLANMTALPFKDHVFDCIICDPPHLKCGENSHMAKYYGSWSQTDIIRTMRGANSEFARVMKPSATLILKILPEKLPLYQTLLKNFYFFLPIYTKRLRGSMKNPKGEKDAALWAVGLRCSDVCLS